ncbi:MAG: hypothetical protein WBE76_21820 [Terracidiphilus sp.]
MNWWKVLEYFVGALFFGAEWIKERQRTHAIRALARKLDLTFLGKKKLPEALSLYGTPFAHIDSMHTSNLIDGSLHGTRVIAFDCQVFEDKSSWQRTVIAAKTSGNIFNAAAANPEFKIDRSAGWSILYQSKEFSAVPEALMPATDLEAHLDAIEN